MLLGGCAIVLIVLETFDCAGTFDPWICVYIEMKIYN